jgi:hypothetical protein
VIEPVRTSELKIQAPLADEGLKVVAFSEQSVTRPPAEKKLPSIQQDFVEDAKKWLTRVSVTAAADETLAQFTQLPALKPLDTALTAGTQKAYQTLAPHVSGALKYADLLGLQMISDSPTDLKVAGVNPFSGKFITAKISENLGGFKEAAPLRQQAGFCGSVQRVLVQDNAKNMIVPLENRHVFSVLGKVFAASTALLKVITGTSEAFQAQLKLEALTGQSRSVSIAQTSLHFIKSVAKSLVSWECANLGYQLVNACLFVLPQNIMAANAIRLVTGIIGGSLLSSLAEKSLQNI